MEKEKDIREQPIPVLEEELHVGKRTVQAGVTRVSIAVRSSEEVVEQPLIQEKVEIQHVPIGRFIDRPAQTRTEGDVTVIPVMEEVLVVEKKLRLKEEVHIRRYSETVTQSHKEVLRKEEVSVERFEAPRKSGE